MKKRIGPEEIKANIEKARAAIAEKKRKEAEQAALAARQKSTFSGMPVYQGRGRPPVLRRARLKNINLLEDQWEWLAEQSAILKISQSEVLRQIVDNARGFKEAKAQGTGSGEQG